MIFIVIFLLILILPVIIFISVYNNLQRNRVETDASWSNIGTALQQRNDLIGNLVETVKGYASHESSVLEDVTKWRSLSSNASNTEEQNLADAGLHRAMINLNAVAENYPNLKADQHFASLQNDLARLEEQIKHSRSAYNNTVRNYNAAIAVFPGNLVAGIANLKPRDFFISDEQANKIPMVKF